MINLVEAISGVIQGEKKLSYALGRFKLVRHTYSSYRKLSEVIKRENKHIEGGTIFAKLSIDQINQSLQRDAVFLGLNLPTAFVEEIKTFAEHAPLTREDDSPLFYYEDVREGRLADGSPVPQAIAVNPLECDAIKRIACDSLVLKVISQYLGYYPNQVLPVLKWSFVTEIPDPERLKLHQTVYYHYDVHGFNFFYANFYLLDTDRYSGAHVMVKASHNSKPLWMLLNSTMQPEQVLYDYYGQENELIIEGKAGYGFLQDASCYHKALKPTVKERLMLQIRYW